MFYKEQKFKIFVLNFQKIVPQGFSVLCKTENQTIGIIMVTHPTTSIPVDESKFESKNFELNQEVSLY